MSNRARHQVWPTRCCIVLLAVVLGAAAIACGDGGAPAVDGVTLSPSASPSGGDRQKGNGQETASPSATFTPSPATGGGTGDGDAGTPTPSPTRISDKTIRGNILVRLSQDPALRDFEFKVVVTKGVVQLVGRVQTEKQKRAAEQIAVTEPGVKKVISYVQVTGGGGY